MTKCIRYFVDPVLLNSQVPIEQMEKFDTQEFTPDYKKMETQMNWRKNKHADLFDANGQPTEGQDTR